MEKDDEYQQALDLMMNVGAPLSFNPVKRSYSVSPEENKQLFELYRIALSKEDNPKFAVRWAVRRLDYFNRNISDVEIRKEIEDEYNSNSKA